MKLDEPLYPDGNDYPHNFNFDNWQNYDQVQRENSYNHLISYYEDCEMACPATADGENAKTIIKTFKKQTKMMKEKICAGDVKTIKNVMGQLEMVRGFDKDLKLIHGKLDQINDKSDRMYVKLDDMNNEMSKITQMMQDDRDNKAKEEKLKIEEEQKEKEKARALTEKLWNLYNKLRKEYYQKERNFFNEEWVDKVNGWKGIYEGVVARKDLTKLKSGLKDLVKKMCHEYVNAAFAILHCDRDIAPLSNDIIQKNRLNLWHTNKPEFEDRHKVYVDSQTWELVNPKDTITLTELLCPTYNKIMSEIDGLTESPKDLKFNEMEYDFLIESEKDKIQKIRNNIMQKQKELNVNSDLYKLLSNILSYTCSYHIIATIHNKITSTLTKVVYKNIHNENWYGGIYHKFRNN